MRWNSDVPRCASSRDTALDTVALERPSVSAAALNECCSTTVAKIAQASRSGSRIALFPHWRASAVIVETICFQRFRLRGVAGPYLGVTNEAQPVPVDGA